MRTRPRKDDIPIRKAIVPRVNNEDILRSQVAVDGDLCDTYVLQSPNEIYVIAIAEVCQR